MSYALPYRAPSLARNAIVAAAVSVAALIVPTHSATAQLGGLVKKARDKVVENQVDKQIEKRTGSAGSTSTEAPPKFDDVTLELTADRVDGVLRGLSAGRAILDGTSAAPGRATLVARRDAAYEKSGTLSSQNEKLLDAYREKHDASRRCRNDAMNASQDKRQKEVQQRSQEFQAKAMSDPAYRDKMVALSQKMAVAQQRGDTAELRRLGAELGLETNSDAARADTLAADEACGREPPKPAVLVQIEQLDSQGKELTEQIRKLEEKSAATEVKESGLNERQFHMARERIEAYLSAVKYKSQPGGFSAAELQTLSARRADLEKAM